MGYDFACFILSVCYSIPMTDKKTKLIMVTDHQKNDSFFILIHPSGDKEVISAKDEEDEEFALRLSVAHSLFRMAEVHDPKRIPSMVKDIEKIFDSCD